MSSVKLTVSCLAFSSCPQPTDHESNEALALKNGKTVKRQHGSSRFLVAVFFEAKKVPHCHATMSPFHPFVDKFHIGHFSKISYEKFPSVRNHWPISYISTSGWFQIIQIPSNTCICQKKKPHSTIDHPVDVMSMICRPNGFGFEHYIDRLGMSKL